MNLAFGALWSREPPATVGQLLDAIGPFARVWVHHDPTKGPRPSSQRDEVTFVPHPVATTWGDWTPCEAILALLREALRDPGWGYFQLLGGSCLAIRPLDAFAAHVERSAVDLHMNAVALGRDEVAPMRRGFKAYAPTGALRHRVLRRMRRVYLGEPERQEQRAGLGFAVPAVAHPFGPGFDCWVGSTWWGARSAQPSWPRPTTRCAGTRAAC
jgi:hypothetical protein